MRPQVVQRSTKPLSDDHQMVLKKLDDFEEVINNLDKPDTIMPTLKELGTFFKGEIWIHFAKEEDALFVEMAKFMPIEGGPIGVMLLEHEELRKANDEFQKGLEVYVRNPDDAKAAALIRQNGMNIIQMLRPHIDKEDNILYMMAEMHLDDTQTKNILKVYEEIEKRFQ
ncbi:TPA: hypothetical protein EYP66_15015 [Candidatus Poribacteria bacterium]|nr:hypothetical protein [Candidatus Poribacteria bacterium]